MIFEVRHQINFLRLSLPLVFCKAWVHHGQNTTCFVAHHNTVLLLGQDINWE